MGKPNTGYARCLYCSMEKDIFQCFSYFVYKLMEYFVKGPEKEKAMGSHEDSFLSIACFDYIRTAS